MDLISYDDEGNPIVTKPPLSSHKQESSAIYKLTGIFEIEGKSFDVVLNGNKITFASVLANGKGR